MGTNASQCLLPVNCPVFKPIDDQETYLLGIFLSISELNEDVPRILVLGFTQNFGSRSGVLDPFSILSWRPVWHSMIRPKSNWDLGLINYYISMYTP